MRVVTWHSFNGVRRSTSRAETETTAAVLGAPRQERVTGAHHHRVSGSGEARLARYITSTEFLI